MLLTSPDGSQVEAHVVGYEFPHNSENWLLVQIGVATTSGTGLAVVPCWEVREARRIVSWFRAISQSVPVKRWGGACLEPNLEFELHGETRRSVILRASIILEHGVWTSSDGSQPMPDYALSVDLELERSQLSQAANDLDDELSQYPPREPETPLPSHFMEAPRGVKSVSQGTQMSDLCQRIYRHCQARNWFGPDSGDDTSARIVPTQYDTFGDPFEVVKPPLFDTFAQPPATKYEIDQAEEKLQQELPGALKAIYLELANGGFGPGLGLATAGSLSGVSRGNWKVNERAATYLRDHPRRYLECDDLPEGFVRLCNWGCGLTSDLDVWSGHIYGRGAGIRSDWNSVSPEASEYVHWIAFQADSAEEWFDLWLRGVLRQPLSTLEAFENLLD